MCYERVVANPDITPVLGNFRVGGDLTATERARFRRQSSLFIPNVGYSRVSKPTRVVHPPACLATGSALKTGPLPGQMNPLFFNHPI